MLRDTSCLQQEQEGICHQVWIGEVQDSQSSCQSQQSPPKNQIPCQDKVFCSQRMQQHSLVEAFFYLLGTFDFGKILLTLKTPVYAELLIS